jgi:dethiobiotin synthetase
MKPKKTYFVTAIGTDSGKTLISAIVTQALQADYWKPIQAGLPRDTDTVRSLVSNPVSRFHDEAYLLQHPLSPHAAAQLDGVEIRLGDIRLPATSNSLVVEGAGGALVPINDTDFVIDIAHRMADSVILVANIYLGSINHTLLTINELKRRNIPVAGIVFNGPDNPETKRIILKHSNYPMLLHVYPEEKISSETVDRYTLELQTNLTA